MNLGSNKKLSIRDKLEVASKEDNIKKTLLRWFGHVQNRSVDVSVEKIEFFRAHKHFKSRCLLVRFEPTSEPNQTEKNQVCYVT